MRLHLDTDFAGDTDDACALALLLGWPDVEIVGVTTTADPDGRRAGYVFSFLEVAGRTDIPVAAGAGSSLTTGDAMGTIPDHGRYWPEPVAPRPSPMPAADELLAAGIEGGATVVAIGPFTNLAHLERAQPGILDGVPVVAMGGWIDPPAPGLPAWGADMDWNVQCDTGAALAVVDQARLTLVTLPATLTAHLRAAHLPRLSAVGPLGALLARQAQAHADDNAMAVLGRSHAALPDDLLNFQYDPVTGAIAAGWPGAVTEELILRPVMEGDVLRFERADAGRRVEVVTHVDGEAFAEAWLTAVEVAGRVAQRAESPAYPPPV